MLLLILSSEPCSLILQLHYFIDVIVYFIPSPLLLSPQVSAVSPPQTAHTSTYFSLTRHSNLEFSCSFVVMTMHSFNLILDLCLRLLMIFRLLCQSILLFTATDIIKQCPCTSASSSPHYPQTSHQTPDKSEFQLLIFFSCACHRIRHQHCVLPDCSFVPHSNLLTAITDSRLCLLLALFFCLLLAMLLLHGFLSPFPGCFFFSQILGFRPWLFFFFLKKKNHHSNFHH